MPFANIKVVEGVFSEAKKEELINTVTEALIKVEGEAMRPLTWVVVEEVKKGNWAIGGEPLLPPTLK
jgi:4-oxalocrotonate tautomerase